MVDVVVYSAQWCGQCKPFKQSLSAAGVEYLEVDVDAYPEKAAEKGVRSLPTTLIMNGDLVEATVIGNNTKKVIELLGSMKSE